MKKKISLILLVLLIIIGFLGFKIVGPAIAIKDESYLYIKTASSYAEVEKELVDKKFLPGSTWFKLVSQMLGYDKVVPGKYKLHSGMSVLNLVRMLRNGQQTPVSFIITKIRTKEVLAGRIGKAFECDSLAMLNFLNNNDSLRAYKLDTNTVMCVAMPLTYSIKWTSSPEKIFQQFNQAWTTFWTEQRKAKADSLHLSTHEVSTLASIIDEETNAASDRPYIASVYLNRVRTGMPLQADPTVKFALKNFWLRRIMQVHTKVESPFNTYVMRGLPPGPICTPQEVTIEAVLNSPQTEYLYFVASSIKPGTHIFTTNYADHLKYARVYQQYLNNRNIH